MKKFVNTLMLFIGFTAIFYSAALFTWGKLVEMKDSPNLSYITERYGHMNSRMQEVKNTTDVDLVFLGSSHAYRGFDTRIFKEQNIESFNLGSSSQTPVQTEMLVDRYLEQLNPEHIIYEVFPESFQSDGVESALDVIATDQNDWQSIEMAWKVNHLKVYNTLIFGLIDQNINGLDNSEPKKKRIDTYIEGGFVEKEILTFDIPNKPKATVEIQPAKKQLRSFKNIVSEITEKGITLTVVFTPITNYHYQSYDAIDKFDQRMENNDNFNYYNFNEITTLNDTVHFYDSHHLNQKGVKLFNKQLINVLNMDPGNNPDKH